MPARNWQAGEKDWQTYRKGEATYKPLPLPDGVLMAETDAVAAAAAFRDYMRQRHSVRHYDTRPVPEALIAACIAAAATAPSGANHQPCQFVAISDPEVKSRIRAGAEEEMEFSAGGGGDGRLSALEPIGTEASKPHLMDAPCLIVVFAQQHGVTEDGARYKNDYVPESGGIATGCLIATLHHAGLVCLEHTPDPMKFLPDLCGRPAHEKAVMILPVGYPASDAAVPAVAKRKKPRPEFLTVIRSPRGARMTPDREGAQHRLGNSLIYGRGHGRERRSACTCVWRQT